MSDRERTPVVRLAPAKPAWVVELLAQAWRDLGGR